MFGGTNPRALSRFLILASVALAFAGCAALLSAGDGGLFVDVSR